MSRESYQPDQYTGVRQSAPYVNQNPTLLSTPGNMTYIHGTLANMQYRDTGNVGFQPTLGQMADQFQERARAEARLSNTRSGGSDSGAQGVDEYYDYAAVGIDGGVDHYDDDGNDDEGDGDGEDDPALIAAGNESTGRWTRAEHELFLQALKKFGKVLLNNVNCIFKMKV